MQLYVWLFFPVLLGLNLGSRDCKIRILSRDLWQVLRLWGAGGAGIVSYWDARPTPGQA